VSMIFVEMSMS